MKHYIYFLVLLTSPMLYGQTYYEIGQSTHIRPNGKKLVSFWATEVSITKEARTWKFIDCLVREAGSDECTSYKTSLYQDTSGKWFLDQPIASDERIKCPAKVDEDHIKLHSFSCEYKKNDEVHSFLYRTVSKSAIWKYRHKVGQKEHVANTIMETVDQKTYQEAIKNKKITPLGI